MNNVCKCTIGRRSEPTKLETPCFWYQFLVSGVHNLDTSFWWPVSGTRNLGGELGSCAIHLTLMWYLPFSKNQKPPVNNSATARASRNDFSGVGSSNGSSCINLWRLLPSVPRGATCWLRTGAVRTCTVLWSLCCAYGYGMPCLSCWYCHGNAHFLLDECTKVRYRLYNIVRSRKTSNE